MNLKDWLLTKKISQSALAKQLGMSRSHVNLVINGRIKPGRRFVDVIVAYTDGDVTTKDFGMQDYKANKIFIARPKTDIIVL